MEGVSMAEFVRVASKSELGPDRIIRVVVGGTPIAVANTDGQYYAVQDTCTHDEASLSEGEVFDGLVECPLHGARFDLETGKVRSLPAVFPVATYEVKVEGDDIYVLSPG